MPDHTKDNERSDVVESTSGPELSGQFDGPVAVEGGEAVDARGSKGMVYKPSGPVSVDVDESVDLFFKPVINFIENKTSIPLWIIITLAGIFIMGMVGVGLQGVSLLLNFRKEYDLSPMSGELRIAVESFVEYKEGQYVSSDIGKQVAQLFFSRLQASREEFFNTADIVMKVRGPHQLPILEGTNLEELTLAAQRRASEINAHILLYGIVERDEFGNINITPLFFVSHDSFGDAQELLGEHALGSTIRIRGRGLDDDGWLEANRDLRARTYIAALTFQALGSYLDEEFELALDYLTQIQDDYESESNGMEVVALIAGNVAGRAGNLELAEQYYDTALNIRPGYARAYLGKASIVHQLAIGDVYANTYQEVNLKLLDQEVSLLEKAQEAPYQPETADITSKVEFGLGQVALLRYQVSQRVDLIEESHQRFEHVIAAYDEGGNPRLRELAAHSFGYLGLIARLNGQIEDAIEKYQLAIELTQIPSRQIMYIRFQGDLYYEIGAREEALRCYQAALAEPDLMHAREIQYLETRVQELTSK